MSCLSVGVELLQVTVYPILVKMTSANLISRID